MRGNLFAPATRSFPSPLCFLLFSLVWVVSGKAAQPWDSTRAALLAGDYEKVIQVAGRESQAKSPGEEWPLLQFEALMALGRLSDAEAALNQALLREPQSIRLRWAAREVALALGQTEQATTLLREMGERVSRRRGAYRAPADLVTFGRLALVFGADPKDVLERVFGDAQKADPTLRDVYLARGELALEKHDFALAAKAYREGLEKHPADPDLLYGAARAYEGGSRKAMLEALAAALNANPRHVPSLLLEVDHAVDAEEYETAEALLNRVASINSLHPDVAAYRAVLAHLRNDPAAAQSARSLGLTVWAENPRVDFLIGKKLSQKYRFAEGAAAQRRALAFSADYLPAKAQLASDLLRLGEEGEGWALAQLVHEKDGYDVEAYNLVTLRDTLAKYAVLENDDFIVRMTSREAAVYGPRVLALLTRARAHLVERYGVELAKPTRVDIFGDQKDFAVRTFGLPDVQGFLGVCFGRVITANSPVAVGGKGVNWESVLWHEFCHVVTLQYTHNKMPRWLSEGISVYEENVTDPAWGMQMTPKFRAMIRDGKLTPLAKLSSVFITAPNPEAVQFAYFQSSLVVEFLVDRYGLDAIKGILGDLRDGVESTEALVKRTGPLEEIESEFVVFAQRKAHAFASDAAMEAVPPPLLLPGAEAQLDAWVKKNPESLWGPLAQARRLAREEKWTEAIPLLERLVERFPTHTDLDGPYPFLVAGYRALSQTDKEEATLNAWTRGNDESSDAFLRLMELAEAKKDWAAVARNAERFLAINPMVYAPYRFLAKAQTELGQAPAAIAACATLLQLEPPNPSDVHFQLAELMAKVGDPAARTHVLAALEDAPRHRAALALLLQLQPAATPANP
ncbi:MAG TPA: peptidase MA family metallohydrolase [Opitutaceae bacterium]|nr:peptidase MA family metallohydrolase [Opitutaceae bacterium]